MLRVWCICAMLHKTQRAYDPSEYPADKRLKMNIIDLYATNTVSAARTQELLNDAADAGVRPCRRLRRKQRGCEKNVARDLKRKLLKNCAWPSLYIAGVRVWDTKMSCEVRRQMSFLLPHEVLSALARHGDSEHMYDTRRLDPNSLAHLRHCEQQAHGRLVALGLWGDGAPCNWDRTESLEVFSLNLPGLDGEYRTLRVPIVALSKKNVASQHTFDDILNVVAWSLRCAATGTFPEARRDQAEWKPSDKKRQALSGQSLGCAAALVEVRGDWMFFKECFHFPGWQEKAQCCWRCRCGRDGIRNVRNDAPWWRPEMRMSHMDMMLGILQRGFLPSPLFSAPWVTLGIFQIDWLHAADHGVTAEYLGNLLFYLLRKFPAKDNETRVKLLWADMQRFYDTSGTQDRINSLLPQTLRQDKKSPTLKASAAQATQTIRCCCCCCCRCRCCLACALTLFIPIGSLGLQFRFGFSTPQTQEAQASS